MTEPSHNLTGVKQFLVYVLKGNTYLNQCLSGRKIIMTKKLNVVLRDIVLFLFVFCGSGKAGQFV